MKMRVPGRMRRVAKSACPRSGVDLTSQYEGAFSSSDARGEEAAVEELPVADASSKLAGDGVVDMEAVPGVGR